MTMRGWFRRLLAVTVLIGGLSIATGAPAHAESFCMRLGITLVGDSGRTPLTCIPVP